MNERIRELLTQAQVSANEAVPGDSDDRAIWAARLHSSYEKFAELIVKECGAVAARVGYYNSDISSEFAEGAYFSADRIKQHFGVEE